MPGRKLIDLEQVSSMIDKAEASNRYPVFTPRLLRQMVAELAAARGAAGVQASR